MDVATPTIIADGLSVVGKLGTVALTSIARVTARQVELPMLELTAWQKRVVGCLFGNANLRADIPKLLSLYQQGELMLDELVTRTYRLDQVNEGSQDMREHRNVRGMIRFG